MPQRTEPPQPKKAAVASEQQPLASAPGVTFYASLRSEAEAAIILEQNEARRQEEALLQESLPVLQMAEARRKEEAKMGGQAAMSKLEEEARQKEAVAEQVWFAGEAKAQAEAVAAKVAEEKREADLRVEELQAARDHIAHGPQEHERLNEAIRNATLATTQREEKAKRAQEQAMQDEQARISLAQQQEAKKQQAVLAEMEKARLYQAKKKEEMHRMEAKENQRLKEARLAKEAYERIEELEKQKEREEMEALSVAATPDINDEEADEAMGNRPNTRRCGLPTSIIIRRAGDLWVSSPHIVTKRLTVLFQVRIELCHNANLPITCVLPIRLQKEGQGILYQKWAQGIAGKKRLAEVINDATSFLRTWFIYVPQRHTFFFKI